MSYRQQLHPNIKHLQDIGEGNITVRGVVFATNIPATGVSITNQNRDSTEYIHFPLPVIQITSTPYKGEYDFPIQVELSSFNHLDEIYYRVDFNNYQLYTGSFTITDPCTIRYYGIRLDELMTPIYESAFNTLYHTPIHLIITTDDINYTGSVSIICESDDLNSTIYYTIDGFEPNVNSLVYLNPITISDIGEYVYRFIAINNDNSNIKSEITTRYYNVT